MPYGSSNEPNKLEALQDECIEDLKKQAKRFEKVAQELEGDPDCICLNGVCECGARELRPMESEIANTPFRDWLRNLSFVLE